MIATSGTVQSGHDQVELGTWGLKKERERRAANKERHQDGKGTKGLVNKKSGSFKEEPLGIGQLNSWVRDFRAEGRVWQPYPVTFMD